MAQTALPMEHELIIKDLRKTYARGPEALKGVDLKVGDGDFFALLGPNGAGKSTLIGILTSLVQKTSGTVTVYGKDLDKDPSAVKASLGVVPQEFNFNFFETVLNTVCFQAGYYGIPRRIAEQRAEKLLRSLSLWEKRHESGRNLSGGMKRRLMLARALVNEPKLLILDEPTAGLDIELRRSLWDFLIELNKSGTTIILTTHYLEEAENLCRNIAIIDEGKLLTSEPIDTFLRKLESQVFVFDLSEPIVEPPDLGEDMPCDLIDPTHLQVKVNKGVTMNTVFDRFKDRQLTVESMRNRSNRIEELFLDLVATNKENIRV